MCDVSALGSDDDKGLRTMMGISAENKLLAMQNEVNERDDSAVLEESCS